jgi:carbon monoxide dehydrogenase subunit G
MKVSGNATLHAPADRVFAALNDPAVLVRTIPGCEQLEAVGGDRYRMTITAGVASIKGTYLGDVALTDPQPPSGFTLQANGSGAPGTVRADVRVTLDDQGDGTTLLRYDADAVVGGPVGGVGQRVLSGVAKRTAGEFFQAVDDVLTGVAVEPGPAPALGAVPVNGVAPASGAAPGVPAPGEVFRRPVAAGPAGGGLRDQLPAVLLGAAIALLGVLVGWRLGRAGRRVREGD